MSVRLGTEVRKKPFRRETLSTGVAFWARPRSRSWRFAANTAASPLYRVYQAEFGFSATTLTLLFAVFIVVLLLTLLFFGSVSDYVGRRRVMLAGLVFRCGRVRLVLARARGWTAVLRPALQGVAVGLIAGAASAALHDLRPNSGATPVVSSAVPTGGQALGAIGASVLAQYAVAPTHLVWWLLLAPSSQAPSLCWRCPSLEATPRRRELTAATGQSAAGDEGRLRRGGPRPDRDVGTRRLLSVAGTVASRAAAALEEPALGRPLDLPAHRSRGGSLGCARQDGSIRRDAGRLPRSYRWRPGDVRRDRDQHGSGSAASTEGQRNSGFERRRSTRQSAPTLCVLQGVTRVDVRSGQVQERGSRDRPWPLSRLGVREVERERDPIADDQIAAAQRLLQLHPVVPM